MIAGATPELTGRTLSLRVFRGVAGGEMGYASYQVPETVGMVVLDAVHFVQRNLDTDLACRWNCKAAKCGSCGAEVNGRPALMSRPGSIRCPRDRSRCSP